MKTGIIGCGNIMKAYGKGGQHYGELDYAACADLDVARAKAVAEEWGIPRGCSVDELLADDAIELVINLTIPGVHAEIDRQIIAAGKHAYSEKPLALARDEIDPVLAQARAAGLRVGCAPDTFLGGGLQTCRKLIDDGAIGRPIGAVAHLAGHGHESWHPSPQFYYQPGGGPLFDMGPYYLTALVNCLGPVARVSGAVSRGFDEREITSEPLTGTRIPVEVDTHIQSTLSFADGAIGNLVMSFDVWKHNLPRLEIYGSEGSLALPDPNGFGGPVRLFRAGDDDWQEIPLSHDTGMRGLGAADMCNAIAENRPHRASGELAYHVLDIMQSIVAAGHEQRVIELESSCQRPEPLPADAALSEA